MREESDWRREKNRPMVDGVGPEHIRRILRAAYAIDFPSVPDAQDARALLEQALNQLDADKQSPTLCKRIRLFLQRTPGEP